MMRKIAGKVRTLRDFELRESRKNYEQFFPDRRAAHEILFEELGETEDALSLTIEAGVKLNDCVRQPDFSREKELDAIRVMELWEMNTACEAIQTAAMCKKWRESMGVMDAVADGDSKSAKCLRKTVAPNGR